ncbi:unnamed protein product [Amoebophrya sp. A120]|nr:unnamed protein product [Amoebophrya sp. A120]|eukprot:GSA120T00021407001.1
MARSVPSSFFLAVTQLHLSVTDGMDVRTANKLMENYTPLLRRGQQERRSRVGLGGQSVSLLQKKHRRGQKVGLGSDTDPPVSTANVTTTTSPSAGDEPEEVMTVHAQMERLFREYPEQFGPVEDGESNPCLDPHGLEVPVVIRGGYSTHTGDKWKSQTYQQGDPPPPDDRICFGGTRGNHVTGHFYLPKVVNDVMQITLRHRTGEISCGTRGGEHSTKCQHSRWGQRLGAISAWLVTGENQDAQAPFKASQTQMSHDGWDIGADNFRSDESGAHTHAGSYRYHTVRSREELPGIAISDKTGAEYKIWAVQKHGPNDPDLSFRDESTTLEDIQFHHQKAGHRWGHYRMVHGENLFAVADRDNQGITCATVIVCKIFTTTTSTTTTTKSTTTTTTTTSTTTTTTTTSKTAFDTISKTVVSVNGTTDAEDVGGKLTIEVKSENPLEDLVKGPMDCWSSCAETNGAGFCDKCAVVGGPGNFSADYTGACCRHFAGHAGWNISNTSSLVLSKGRWQPEDPRECRILSVIEGTKDEKAFLTQRYWDFVNSDAHLQDVRDRFRGKLVDEASGTDHTGYHSCVAVPIWVKEQKSCLGSGSGQCAELGLCDQCPGDVAEGFYGACCEKGAEYSGNPDHVCNQVPLSGYPIADMLKNDTHGKSFYTPECILVTTTTTTTTSTTTPTSAVITNAVQEDMGTTNTSSTTILDDAGVRDSNSTISTVMPAPAAGNNTNTTQESATIGGGNSIDLFPQSSAEVRDEDGGKNVDVEEGVKGVGGSSCC